ncbi:MAG: hypothetical protein IPG50_04950 [Myxococcales bacterium]|nr:hypothetical protein [Myxococcales bacterium]
MKPPARRSVALPEFERLHVERDRAREALASPERQRDQVRSRKVAAIVIVLLALAPVVLFFSGRSFNRPRQTISIHRELLLRDALLEAVPTFDRCFRGPSAAHVRLHVSVDERGGVTRVATNTRDVDAACVQSELRSLRAPPTSRATVTSLDVVLFPAR